ncbi:unnamed protein product [Cuscuta europaea]|uniref:Uncharacterized protein n=1 Tax=Cuscuta europaea TaxID=41803 RepID=A0A9P0ZHJ7_CUSEU|nr:unnamed protein product [Cuscuta europaea]
MKGKEITNNGRHPASSSSSDLLVCFPSRITHTMKARLLLEPNKRNPAHKKLLALRSAGSRSGQANSPALQWSKSKTSEIADEPKSPKVTCAGQVKVQPDQPARSCKDWQSVMHEIERLHKRRKYKRTPSSSSSLWFKKDVMQFITCLRNIRFDFRCFGAFPSSAVDDITSDEDEDEDEKEEEEEAREVENTEGKDKEDNESSSAVFSKWFMVLQENQNPEINATEKDSDVNPPCVPPPNALLLMRCRSAPAKSWLKEIQAKEDEERSKPAENEEGKESATSTNSEEEDEEEEEEDEKEKTKKDMSLVVMGYGDNFCKLSSDIAKETWVVAGIRDPLISRSRSCKR